MVHAVICNPECSCFLYETMKFCIINQVCFLIYLFSLSCLTVFRQSKIVVNILYHSVRFLQMLRLFPKFLIYINLIYTAKALLHASIGLHICMVSLCWLTPRHHSILLKAVLINWVCKSWHAGLPFLYTLMM